MARNDIDNDTNDEQWKLCIAIVTSVCDDHEDRRDEELECNASRDAPITWRRGGQTCDVAQRTAAGSNMGYDRVGRCDEPTDPKTKATKYCFR